MASSNDFEKIWESYQEVVKTKDIFENASLLPQTIGIKR